MDSGVGDDPKSSKTYRRQRQRLRIGRMSLLRVEAQETELPKPASAGFLLTKNSICLIIVSMKRSNIKETFGGEVAFTKFISQDITTAKRLINAISAEYDDGFQIKPEDHTIDSKRVDLVIRDSENIVAYVIESQDCTGWLDSIHASKILYYMYEKECFEGILLCEDADEHIKGFVRWCNENTPVQIWLMQVICYDLPDKSKYVEFVPLIRPGMLKDKKIRRVNSEGSGYVAPDFSEVLQEKFDQNPGLFTNITARYLSSNGVGGNGINVGINPRKSGFFMVNIWHAGKWNNDKFKNSFNNFVKEYKGMEGLHQERQSYINLDTWDEAIDAVKAMIEALKNKAIVG